MVTLYTHPDCTYSDALKGELKEAGTVFDEIDLSLRPEAWERLEELTGGERITPVLVDGEKVEVGFHGIG
ncbi:MAG: UXX-star (seleno)protein family 2 [Chloroflexi bacterium]|nr:UXX-star (seleno)protein family 2 [Chloroflexota bacterium]